VPVSRGEFTVLSTLVTSVLPALLGWDVWRDVVQFSQSRPEAEGGAGYDPYAQQGYDDGPPF